VIHDGMPYDLIQGQGEGQGHGGLKCVKMVDFKVSLASMQVIQESPAVADKPARRESLSKLFQFDVPTTLSRQYWPIFMLLRPKSAKSREIH